MGCRDPFFKTKHVRSAFVVPGDTELLIDDEMIRIFLMNSMLSSTYSGPGSTLAPRINEYGIITIGLVGSARYGGGGVDTVAGLLIASGGLCERLFEIFVLMAAAAEAVPETCCCAVTTTGTGGALCGFGKRNNKKRIIN